MTQRGPKCQIFLQIVELIHFGAAYKICGYVLYIRYQLTVITERNIFIYYQIIWLESFNKTYPICGIVPCTILFTEV